MPGQVLTGARARFTLGEKSVGYATGVTVRESIQYEPIKTLDNIEVIEHVPVDYEVSLTADFIRIIGDSLKVATYFPHSGASTNDHLANILAQGELSAVITADASTAGPEVVLQVEGVRVSEQNTSISARGVVGLNVTMVGRVCYDEADRIPAA